MVNSYNSQRADRRDGSYVAENLSSMGPISSYYTLTGSYFAKRTICDIKKEALLHDYSNTNYQAVSAHFYHIVRGETTKTGSGFSKCTVPNTNQIIYYSVIRYGQVGVTAVDYYTSNLNLPLTSANTGELISEINPLCS